MTDSFWEEKPKAKYWKKTIIIIGSLLFVIVASFGVASAKYGYQNVSYFISHGHTKTIIADKHLQTIPNTEDSPSNTEDKALSDKSYNFDTSETSTTPKNDFFSDSTFGSNSDNLSTPSYSSSAKSKNSNNGFVTPPEYESAGAIAICNDYTYSHEQHSSSTCSSHQGVMYWLDGTDSNTTQKKKVCVENTSMKQLYEQQYQNQVNSIKQQETYELGQARVYLANRGIDSASGSYLATIQGIEDKYDLQLSNLKIEYDQKINGVEPVCHYE